jgi:hypothetical protein
MHQCEKGSLPEKLLNSSRHLPVATLQKLLNEKIQPGSKKVFIEISSPLSLFVLLRESHRLPFLPQATFFPRC